MYSEQIVDPSAGCPCGANRPDAGCLIEKIVAGNSPPISEPRCTFILGFAPLAISRGLAPISLRQDWLQGRNRAMCVAVRTGGRTAHEKQVRTERSSESGE
jgi:hypothetical protein